MKKIILLILTLILLSSLTTATWTRGTTDLNNYFTLSDTETDGSITIGYNNSGNGTITGATTGVTGKINESYYFDGVNDDVDFFDTPYSILSTNSWTINMWVKFETATGSTTLSSPYGEANDINWYGHWYLRKSDTSWGIQVFDGAAAQNFFTTNIIPSDINWHMYTVTWNSSSTDLKAYVDGVLKVTYGGVTSDFDGVTETMGLGKRRTSAYFNGSVDEVGIWTDILTGPSTNCTTSNTSEICYIYNNNVPNSSQQPPFPLPPPPSIDNFSITTISAYSSSVIYNFSAVINGTIYNDNGTGIIITNILENSTSLYNITINKTGVWFPKAYNLYNVSSDLNATLIQSQINFSCYEKITNNSLTCGNTTTFSPDADTYNWTMNVTEYYNITQEETIIALDNKTIPFYNFYSANLTFLNNFITGPGNDTTSCTYNLTSSTYPSYSESINGTNGSSVGLINGSYLITTDCVDYAYSYENVTIQNATQNVTFDLYTTNSIDIIIYDETTGLLINETNITVTKILGAVQEQNITSTGLISYSNLTAGNYTFTFEGDEYPQRDYSVQIGNKTYQTLNVYLLSNTTDKVIFTFQKYSSTVVIEGVTLTISKIINGSDTLIAVLISDITGRTQFYFDTTERYCFTASLTGYTTKEFCLDPIIFTSYTIKLEESVDLTTGDDYEEILIDWTPKKFNNEENNTISFTFANPEGSLTNYGFNMTYNSTTVSASGTNAYGSVISNTLEITGAEYGDKVTLHYYYKKTGDSEYRTFKQIYEIHGYTSTDDSLLDNPPEDYGLGEFEKTLISVGITTLVAGAGAFYGGALAGGIMAIFMFAWLIYISFLNFWAGSISIILLFIIISWRSSR